jgi:hypothetical protein
LRSGDFLAKNLDDIINHEMGHEQHWDAVNRYASNYGLSVADAKLKLEADIREYISRQIANDP